MTGIHKGVFYFVKQEQPNVFLAGCTLHIVHNAAKKASNTALPPVEDVLIDIFYYFKKSVNRQTRFKGAQDLCDTDQKIMLKHGCTRWLSVGRCVARLLENWDALKVFFLEEKEELDAKKASSKKSSEKKLAAAIKAGRATESDQVETPPDTYASNKVNSVLDFVRSPTNRLFALFLSNCVKVFDHVLLTFQADEPQIHLLRRALVKLIRNLLVRFVKPAAMVSNTVEEVNYKVPYNIKDNQDIVIGEDAQEFMRRKEEHHLRDKRIEEFYTAVKLYYTTLVDYLKEKLPLKDQLLKHAEVADVNLRASTSSCSLRYFLEKYPCLLPAASSKDQVFEQFSLFQSMDISTCLKPRIDATWVAIGRLRDETGSFEYKELSEVMLGILTIPHSSAHCERVFSTVRKNRTDQRASMSDETLETLLVLKSRPGNVTDPSRQHSESALDVLKKVYSKSLKN